ncbi:MAG: flagellar motor switch protein FliN [Pirellulales bacterium]|nr:flagellar motor switch protein FliN [Pirellulales bacterium]
MADSPEDTQAAEAPDAAHDNVNSEASEASKKLGNDDIERLLNEATESLEQAVGDEVSPAAEAQPFSLGDLSPETDEDDRQPIDLLGEVEMDLRIELGRTQMRLEEVLQLRGGSVVALDKLAGDPVDVFVNGRLIARGEVLVMNDNFCIRVTELMSV